MDATIAKPLRPGLGDFSSIVCFKACVKGVEKTLGRRAALVALRSAGRIRGKDLVASLGLVSSAATLDQAASSMREALGPNGTKLCIISDIRRVDEETYRVCLSETVCSAGEPEGSDTELSFTFGAIHGAMEALTGKRLRGKQVGSVLRGQDHDIIEFRIFE